ncbi:MAG: hypothetical protein KI790_20815, partial [Cyclobacteriaceae bacterium]|nr:hypothetical protein [Cyclobacteriaceae bacterium HetDA_MAG_MS6]
MPGEEKVILPEKYYLDYFNYLIRFVEEQYDHVLGKEDRSFVSHFRSLSEDARCLFIRFSNRKGPFFRVSKLHYQEIQDIPQAIEELLSEGFVTTMFPVESTHFHLFTRVELLQLFHQEKQALEPLKKDEMELYLTENPENLAILQEADQIVQVIKQDELEFFKMLFFGQYKRMMTEFVIRDVGHVQLEKLDDTKFKPWCKSRNEALALFEISKLKESVRTAMKVLPTIDIHPELELIDWSHFLRFDKAGRST